MLIRWHISNKVHHNKIAFKEGIKAMVRKAHISLTFCLYSSLAFFSGALTLVLCAVQNMEFLPYPLHIHYSWQVASQWSLIAFPLVLLFSFSLELLDSQCR